MIYSYQWLKEYIDFSLSPQELMELLTTAGFPVEDSSSFGNDTVFECEIPANRGDLLSIFGLAREIAAVLRKPSPKLSPVFSGKGKVDASMKVRIFEPSLCPFYSARIIKGIEVGPSPDWLREKLVKAKIRPINNIVDITNLVLLETGQPLHAFDLRKVGKEIVVRCASPGEKIKTLDGEMRILNKSMLVVADKEKSLAIAGIIGGEESQVADSTSDILLESAYFSPFSIRKTANALNLTTESSLRFERGVTPEGVLFALNRASWLIEKECKGKIGRLNRAGVGVAPDLIRGIRPSGLDESSPYNELAQAKACDYQVAATSEPAPAGLKRGLRRNNFEIPYKKLKLRKKKVSSLLGIEISSEEIKKILTSLNFKLSEKKGLFEIVVPSFRQDIKQEVDIIEEVARLYGYGKIPAKVPEAKITPFSENREEKVASLIRRILTSFGLNEIITSNFSFFSEGLDCVKILNPLTTEQSALRTNLLSSLLLTFSHNLNQGNKKMAFFELGKVYADSVSSGTSFQEKLMLSIGLYDSGNFFHLKGILEEFLKRMGISNYTIKDFKHNFLEENAAGIFIDNKFLGYFGKVSKKILSSMKLSGEVYLTELDFELLAKFGSFTREFKPLPKYPAIRRDLAVVADQEIRWKDITKIIKDTSPLIKKVELFDLYKGKDIPSGYRGLAFSILYRSAERTLTKKEVGELDEKVETKLRQRYRIEIRRK